MRHAIYGLVLGGAVLGCAGSGDPLSIASQRIEAGACNPPPGGYATTVQHYVPFRNRFGEQIAVDLYLPADATEQPLTTQGCRFPVVLETSPYRDWTTPQPTKVDEDAKRKWWAARGYVFAFADVPGTGASEGSWCLLCEHEQLSGVDMVEALGEAPWSTGDVGLIGSSYPGINALLIAQRAPAHLRAIIAGNFFTSPYSDLYFVNGMPRLEDALVLGAAYTGLSRWTGYYAVPAPEDLNRFTTIWFDRVTAPPPSWVTIQAQHPTNDAWYREREIHPERIHIPTYILGGWNDMFSRSTWSAFDTLGSSQKFILAGPFTHAPVMMPNGAWPCASQSKDFCGAPVFDYYLRGQDSPEFQTLQETPVRYYIQPNGAAPTQPYLSSPTKPSTVPWVMPLGAAGQNATLLFDPTAGLTTGQWFLRGTVPGAFTPLDYYLGLDGPADQRVEELKGLSFASPPLDGDVTVVGSGHASLLITCNRPDTDLVVRLVDEWPVGSEFPLGYAYLVTSGWLRASHRNGDDPSAVAPLSPGLPTRVDIDIFPTGYRFARGHKIRVDIAPADVPRFAPLLQLLPPSVSIDLGASSITLPSL